MIASRVGVCVVAVLAGCGDAQHVADAGADATPRPPLSFTTVATIPNGMFDLPRYPTGIAAVNGQLFVGLTNTNESAVVAIDGTGMELPYADGMTPTYGNNIGGLATNAAGDLYIAVPHTSVTEYIEHGFVYRVPAGGAPPVLVADLPAPGASPLRSIEVDGDTLFVTTGRSTVLEIDATGAISTWVQSALLTADMGSPTSCPYTRSDWSTLDGGGAQGIVRDGNNRYVTEPDRGRIIRVPINADGTAGTPEVFASSCAKLAGIVGLAVVSPGVLIGVVTRPHAAIVEIRDDGQTIETLHSGEPLGRPFAIARDVAANRWAITDWTGPNEKGRVLTFSVP